MVVAISYLNQATLFLLVLEVVEKSEEHFLPWNTLRAWKSPDIARNLNINEFHAIWIIFIFLFFHSAEKTPFRAGGRKERRRRFCFDGNSGFDI